MFPSAVRSLARSTRGVLSSSVRLPSLSSVPVRRFSGDAELADTPEHWAWIKRQAWEDPTDSEELSSFSKKLKIATIAFFLFSGVHLQLVTSRPYAGANGMYEGENADDAEDDE
jgi:hypothetical protein